MLGLKVERNLVLVSKIVNLHEGWEIQYLGGVLALKLSLSSVCSSLETRSKRRNNSMSSRDAARSGLRGVERLVIF